MPPSSRKRWLIAVVAGAVAVAGIVVSLARDREADQDRIEIARFRRERLPSVERARAAHVRLGVVLEDQKPGGTSLVDRLRPFRAELERARRELTTGSTADIVKPALAEFLSGVGLSLRALAVVEEAALRGETTVNAADRKAFRDSWSSAQRRFDRGSELFEDLG